MSSLIMIQAVDYRILGILLVLYFNILVNGQKPLACSKELCQCNTGERPSVICRQKSLTVVPDNIPPDIKVLDLTFNKIKTIEEDDFQNLEQLETLFLQSNNIERIHSRAFRNLYKLRNLVLQQNKLTTVTSDLFQHLSNIRVINLQINSISNVSKDAFTTLPNNREVTIQFHQNPLQCGCEVKALKKWAKQISLNLENFRCANARNKRLDEMSDKDFPECSDEEESIFVKSPECLTCVSATSHSQCRMQGKPFHCSGDKAACLTAISYDRGSLNITKGCEAYKLCMQKEWSNQKTCPLQQLPRLQCNYCCVGELCNEGNGGGRTKDFKFYMRFAIDGGKISSNLQDPNSTEYREMSHRLESAFKELFQSTHQGGYTVLTLGFTPPGLEAHFKIYITHLSTHDTVSAKILLNEAVRTGAEALIELRVKRDTVRFHTEGPSFCSKETTTTAKGEFQWHTVPVDFEDKVICPYQPASSEVHAVATRMCVKSSSGESIWEDPKYSNCPFASEVTRKLEELSKTKVTSRNVLQMSEQLRALTREYVRFSKEDVGFAVDLVDKILNEPSSLSSRETIDNTLASLSYILAISKTTLLEAEQESQASTRLMSSIDKIVNSVSLDEGNLITVEPNLAVVAIKVDPDNFPGLTFSTEAAHSSNVSLSRDEVTVDNDTTSGDPKTRTSILLPSTMFSNLPSDKKKAVTRITFALYKSDKLFSVYQDARQGPSINPLGRHGHGENTRSPKTGNISMATEQPLVSDGSKKNSTVFTTEINSHVIAATVPNVAIQNLSQPVLISFVHSKKNSTNSRCVFWDNGSQSGHEGWSSSGCRVSKMVNDTYTTCACSHLTNFALLMDVYSNGFLTETDRKILSIISYIGCGISLLALLLTLVTYMMFRKLRRDNPAKILVNLCIALAVADLIFIVGMHDYTFSNPAGCKAVAILLHYFMLSALTWMAVEAFYMYLALVIVFKTYFTNFILKCCLIGWGVPLVVVAITLGVNSTDNYGLLDTGICWIKNPAFYGAFLAPVALILVLNFIAFGLVLRQILGISARKLNKSDKTSTITQLRGAVGVIILLGLTWVFAVFAIDQASVVFYYLFAVFNSLQGLFIFIFYCLFKKDALNAWRRKLPCCEVSDEKSGDRTSRGYTATAPVVNSTGKQSTTSTSVNNSEEANIKQRGINIMSEDSGIDSSNTHSQVHSQDSTTI